MYYLTSDGKENNLSEDASFVYIDQPALSPSGKLVAFGTEKGIYSLDIDSRVVEELSSSGRNPAWKPDGLEIAFEAGEGTYVNSYTVCPGAYPQSCVPYSEILSNQQIFRINLTESGAYVGYSPLIGYRSTILPAWNNNGLKFAYVKRQNVDFLCAITNLEWYADNNCIQIENYVDTFAWHPKEDKIIFSATRKSNSEIYLFDTSDFSQINITNGSYAYDNFSPVWNHAGTRIAFVSDRDGNNEIYIMDIDDGTVVQNLTQSSSNDFSPIWSPDDKKIIFVSDRTNNLDIFSVDVNTLQIINLTKSPDNEFSPIAVNP